MHQTSNILHLTDNHIHDNTEGNDRLAAYCSMEIVVDLSYI